jgi:hypothetical protein
MKIFLLAMTIVCVAGAGALNAQELITNGGFEAWTTHDNSSNSAMPNGWVRGAGAVGTQYFYGTDATQGNVLQLTDPAPPQARRFRSPTFPISSAGTYRVTFKVKSNGSGTIALRGVILVKGTSETPKTNEQSATNHYTTISGYTGTASLSEWTTLSYDIEVPDNATFGNDYCLHISWSHTANASNFYIDDISLTKLAGGNTNLASLSVFASNYVMPASNKPDSVLTGFASGIHEYAYLTSDATLPVVKAAAESVAATVDIQQATSFASQAERTATIIVTNGDNKGIYTVEFQKYDGFISGVSWNIGSANLAEWSEFRNLYTRNSPAASYNHGSFAAMGNTSMRTNSTDPVANAYISTPVLANGASTVSFWLKNFEIATDATPVVVLKKTTEKPDWEEVGRVVPNTSDYNNVWKQIVMSVNDNSTGLQIRFLFEKNSTAGGKTYLDDVEIKPHYIGTGIKTQPRSSLLAWVVNGEIVLKQNAEILKSENFEIYTLLGQKVRNYGLSTGVYVVKAGTETVKVAVN